MAFLFAFVAVLGLIGLARGVGFSLGAAIAALRVPLFILGGIARDLARWVRRRG